MEGKPVILDLLLVDVHEVDILRQMHFAADRTLVHAIESMRLGIEMGLFTTPIECVEFLERAQETLRAADRG